MKSRVGSGIAACIGLAVGTVAYAAPLNLVSTAPDATSDFVKVLYTSSNSTFSAIGSPVTFDVNGNAPPDYNISPGGSPSETLNITMTVNPSTGASTGGTITLTGKINTPPADNTAPTISETSGTLLTGTIASGTSSFGFPTGGGTIFEFLFTVTGGDLASYYGGIGGTGGTIVSGKFNETGAIPFTGSFQSNFQNTSAAFSNNGVADTFIVPEPVSLSGAVISMLALSRGARRMRRAAENN